MHIRRALLLLALSAMLVVTACGSGDDKKDESKATSAPAVSSAAAGATQAAATQAAAQGTPIDKIDLGNEPIKLVFWHTQTGVNADKLKSVIEGFQKKYPNITIDAQFNGNYTDNYKKVNAAITGGGLPDLSVAYPSMVSDWQQADKIVPLDDYINSVKYGFTKAELDDFFPVFLGESRNYPEFGNKYYSFPFTKSLLVMYYNQDALDKAGLKVPETWDDFHAAAKKVTSGSVKGYAYDTSASTFKGWVFSRGGKVISDDGKTWEFNKQAGIDSLQLLEDMIKDGSAYNISKAFADQTDFGQGQAIFTMGSTSGIPFYDKEVGGKFKWGLANLPHGKDNPSATVLYGGSITMFKTNDAKKQLASWLFIKYFTSPEVTADWGPSTGYFPVRKSAVNMDPVKKKIAEFPSYGVALNQILPTGKPEESVSGSQDVRLFIEAAMTAAVQDPNKNVKDLLNEAAQKAQKAIGR